MSTLTLTLTLTLTVKHHSFKKDSPRTRLRVLLTPHFASVFFLPPRLVGER